MGLSKEAVKRILHIKEYGVNVTVKKMKWYTTFGEIKIFEQTFLLDLCGKDLTGQELLESGITEGIPESYR